MVVISAGDLPVAANECSQGPEHWCTNIVTAKNCRATKHCIQTVWERQTVAEDSGTVCEVCKQMVEEARDQLLSNETQEEMKQVFEGSCKLMPIKMVRMNCIKVCTILQKLHKVYHNECVFPLVHFVALVLRFVTFKPSFVKFILLF